MTNPIRGFVARILNTRELVLNIGSEHNVRQGMYFDVLDPNAENITDPKSGELLGSIDRPKVRVKITTVQERLSIASTYKQTKTNVGGIGGMKINLPASSIFARELMPPKWITKYETLKTEEKTWEDLDEEKSYVKTGDPVVQVMVANDDDTEVVS